MKEETKTIKIPDGYEFDRVEEGKVIFNKVEKGLPNTWKRCVQTFNHFESITTGYVCGFQIDPRQDVFYCDSYYLPDGLGKPMLALCQLLVCRNAWWKQLGWKPAWKDPGSKYIITTTRGIIDLCDTNVFNTILAFPTNEVRDQFYEAFKDLIEEAKELL